MATGWQPGELSKIAEWDDLHVSPFREDGTTFGTPTWIWSVVVDGQVYARPYNGQNSRWYKAAIAQKAGRITSAGLTKEVEFEPIETSAEINDRVDDAYREKYGDSEFLPPMIEGGPRATTVRIVPKG